MMAVLNVASYVVGALLLAWAAFYCAATFAPKAFEAFLMRHLAHYDIQQTTADGSLYLRRFYVVPVTLKRKIFLHHVLRSDLDRDPHTHQWPFISIILFGHYREHIYYHNACYCADRTCAHRNRLRDASVGSVLCNSADHTHWLEVVRPVWSLVFVGKKAQTWGFWTFDAATRKDTWVEWDIYLGLRK